MNNQTNGRYHRIKHQKRKQEQEGERSQEHCAARTSFWIQDESGKGLASQLKAAAEESMVALPSRKTIMASAQCDAVQYVDAVIRCAERSRSITDD